MIAVVIFLVFMLLGVLTWAIVMTVKYSKYKCDTCPEGQTTVTSETTVCPACDACPACPTCETCPAVNTNGLTDAAILKIYTDAGCDNFHIEGVTDWAREASIKNLVDDATAWATIADPTHRQGCYVNPPDHLSDQQIIDIYRNAGCDDPGIADLVLDWARSQGREGLIADAKVWATAVNPVRERGCYLNPPDYPKTDQDILDIYHAAGCDKFTLENVDDWERGQTRDSLVADAHAWATLTDDAHRQGCYLNPPAI